jgi:hypothetical protein
MDIFPIIPADPVWPIWVGIGVGCVLLIALAVLL